MKKFYKNNKQETYLIFTMILIAVLIGIKNPVFLPLRILPESFEI